MRCNTSNDSIMNGSSAASSRERAQPFLPLFVSSLRELLPTCFLCMSLGASRLKEQEQSGWRFCSRRHVGASCLKEQNQNGWVVGWVCFRSRYQKPPGRQAGRHGKPKPNGKASEGQVALTHTCSDKYGVVLWRRRYCYYCTSLPRTVASAAACYATVCPKDCAWPGHVGGGWWCGGVVLFDSKHCTGKYARKKTVAT